MTLYNLLTLFIISSLLWKIFTLILLLETRVGYIFFSEQCHVTVVASAFTLPRVKTRTSISRLTVPVRTKTSDALHRWIRVVCARETVGNRLSEIAKVDRQRYGEEMGRGGTLLKNAINLRLRCFSFETSILHSCAEWNCTFKSDIRLQLLREI